VVAPGQTLSATPGELVLAEVLGQRRAGLRTARVVERLGAGDSPQTFSLIAIHSHGLPTEFSAAALAEAERAGPVTAEGRTDLRGLPLVTIDGADARDFDDAVAAEPDPAHPGGWHLVVAIADVAHYVRPDSALDLAAQERGNSAYFPDRVVPMLPEALSNGLCSLRPDQERACLAAHLWIDAEGQLRRHQFVRGLMRSRARLTYEQVQNARDGHPDEVTGPLLEPVIAPLYGAFHTLARARSRRGTLELDLPERQVRLDEHGHAAMITVRPRYDSHRLIEEFMIAANVAAAESLEAASQPLLYRVHDRPSREKLEALREYLASIGLRLPRGHGTKPRDFTQILQQAEHHPQHSAINEAILRAQAQAVYAPDNIGHFGLALARYAHFTSPIRRYADLVVHRALIRAHGFAGGDAGAGDWSRLERVGDHLSKTERRAAAAERDAVDRYTAAFLAERVGATFSGRVAGVTRFGLFVRLEESGADGLVPVRTLPEDWYDHDQARHCLTGRRHGVVYHLGQALAVRLTEANPITGSLLLELAEAGPLAAGERQTGGAGAPGHGKAATSRRKAFGNRGIKRTGR
jgi:ribonuclease R